MSEPNTLAKNSINLLLYEHVEGILENTNAVIFLKDKDGKYLSVNIAFEQECGLKNNEIIGHDDFDVYERSRAEEYRAHNALVLTTEVTKIFRQRPVPQQYFTYKTPLKNKVGRTMGVLGVSFLCENTEDFSQKFCNLQLPLEISMMNSNVGIQINAESTKMLTLRQYDCLYYLIKGMSAKQIAHTLGLSSRTVEDHLHRLKEKFHCNTRFDLISQH